MKMKAAVLYAPNTPLVVEEIDIAEPKAGEVRVKIEAVGLCHTDLHYIKGDMFGPLPMVLGHEGAGIVDAVGQGVTTVKPGDHVLMGVVISCGKCPSCAAGQPYFCDYAAEPVLSGGQMDGTSRLSKGGDPIFHCFAQSSFAQYAVVGETALAKVRKDAPFDMICALGCGFGTGIGAVINNPRFTIKPGASVAIFGCGAVGLSAVIGANLANAKHIVAIDMLDNKLAMAKELGATLTVNASKGNPVERIVLDIGTVDFAFDCVGRPELINQAFDVTKGSGTVVIVGAAPMGVTVSLECFTFIMGKRVVGCLAGFMRPAVDFPRYVDLYMDGKIPLDKLVTHHFKIEEINKAIELLQKGEVIKGVIHP